MDSAESPFLIIGLGNPGPKYAATRHNIGYWVIDELAQRAGATLKKHRSGASIASIRLASTSGFMPGPAAVIATLGCYMNVSGGPAKALIQYYRTPLDRVIVAHDELDIPFGQIRLKQGGGEGGHNGLKSISGALGSKDYLRLRLGVGRPPGRQDPADYVLGDFGKQKEEARILAKEGVDALDLLANAGLVAAQQEFHSRA